MDPTDDVDLKSALARAANIAAAGVSIYDSLAGQEGLHLTDRQVELLLRNHLMGQSLDFPLRTRSKVMKSEVCEALGYPVPTSFKRCRPRFLGQDLDVYVQKSLNLQVWNEELTGSRRYALIRLSDDNIVTDVRVVRGHLLATFDRTGTLTSKFQAKRHDAMASNVLVSASDTATVQALRATEKWCHLFDVTEIFGNLSRLVGKRFANPGKDQERGRGALLHELVELALGEEEHTDTGQFPDVPNQLLELKLQTSPTIDLGLISPDSRDAIQEGCDVSHCDIRYAVFYAHFDGDDVVLDSVVVATGEDFFSFFRRFEGRVVNRKRQIPLPKDLFR